MITRIAFAFALESLISGNSFAGDDPFCGKWKVNFAKSKVTGQQMKMEELEGNKIRFNGSSAISVQNYGARGALSAIGLAKYGSTRQRRSWKLARPYIWRFTSLSRLTWPST